LVRLSCYSVVSCPSFGRRDQLALQPSWIWSRVVHSDSFYCHGIAWHVGSNGPSLFAKKLKYVRPSSPCHIAATGVRDANPSHFHRNDTGIAGGCGSSLRSFASESSARFDAPSFVVRDHTVHCPSSRYINTNARKHPLQTLDHRP